MSVKVTSRKIFNHTLAMTLAHEVAYQAFKPQLDALGKQLIDLALEAYDKWEAKLGISNEQMAHLRSVGLINQPSTYCHVSINNVQVMLGDYHRQAAEGDRAYIKALVTCEDAELNAKAMQLHIDRASLESETRNLSQEIRNQCGGKQVGYLCDQWPELAERICAAARVPYGDGSDTPTSGTVSPFSTILNKYLQALPAPVVADVVEAA